MYAFDIATLVLDAGIRRPVVVQQLLYDADQTGWLGVARIGMGWPLTLLAGAGDLRGDQGRSASHVREPSTAAGDPVAQVEADTGLD